MNKVIFKSPSLKSSFRMFRVRSQGDPEETKNEIMELMNNYLVQNDGKLINMSVLKNKEILCYFVVGDECRDQENWEQTIKRDILSKYEVISSVMELSPANNMTNKQ
ncbi:hypothetical protein ABPG72_011571 [Tetrahymena utriculariae]